MIHNKYVGYTERMVFTSMVIPNSRQETEKKSKKYEFVDILMILHSPFVI